MRPAVPCAMPTDLEVEDADGAGAGLHVVVVLVADDDGEEAGAAEGARVGGRVVPHHYRDDVLLGRFAVKLDLRTDDRGSGFR